MKTLLFLLSAVVVLAFDEPIASLQLTTGKVFRNVTVVRYDRDTVVLKSEAGTGPISYSILPNPLRAEMLSNRDAESAAKTIAAENARKAEEAASTAAMKAAAEKSKTALALETAVAHKQLMAGMNADQLTRAWGSPDKVNVTVVESHRHEQWVYYAPGDRLHPVRSSYVYLRDGAVTSWQVER